MTRSHSVPTLVGAALTLALSALTITPAAAAPSAPVVTWQSSITEGASYVYGQVPAAPTCTATEDLAPVPCTVAGYDTTVGAHVLTATAVASDGVTTTQVSMNYTVTAWTLKGFGKPVKMNVVNKVKGGSTVPLKFKVYEGATKAKSTSVVTSLTAQTYECTTGALTGTASPIPSTHKGFRLKYKDGAFWQNWKTPKAPKATKVKGKKPAAASVCYVVTLTTADASTLSAKFQLK